MAETTRQFECTTCGHLVVVLQPTTADRVRCTICDGAVRPLTDDAEETIPFPAAAPGMADGQDEEILELIPEPEAPPGGPAGAEAVPLELVPVVDPAAGRPAGTSPPLPPPSPPPAPPVAPPAPPVQSALLDASGDRVAISGDGMERIMAELEGHPRLQAIFGVPVSQSLVVVADAGDLRIEIFSDGVPEAQQQEFLQILEGVIERHMGSPGAALPAGAGPVLAPPADAPAALPRPTVIEGRCPKCQAPFRVAVEHAGKRARCKSCKASFVVPDPVRARDELAEQLRLCDKEIDDAYLLPGIIAVVGGLLLLVLSFWLLGFWKGLLAIVILGAAGFVGLWYFVNTRQKQILATKYRARIDELAAKANVSKTELAQHIRANYAELRDVW